MEKRSIGSLSVSVVGVGCNNFGGRLDYAAAEAVVRGALDAGVTLFDTADTYGATQSEVLLGRALGSRRDEAVVATKFGMPIDEERFGAHPDYVRRACDDSLARLGLEHIDLYQLHYPDERVPMADTLGALGELVAEGKVREIGCSNFSAAQLREARAAAGDGPTFVSVQNQYSLLARDPERDGVLAVCEEMGVAFLPFYPLANGLLTGKVRPGQPVPAGTRLATMAPERSAHWLSEDLQRRVGSLLAFAEEVNVPLLTLAFSWLLSHPAVASVIAGASTPDQVRANVAAVRTLEARVLSHLDELTA